MHWCKSNYVTLKIFQVQSFEETIVIDDSDSNESILDEDPISYLHGDHSVLIFSHKTHYNYSKAIEILPCEHKDKVCDKHLIAVEENASFVVYLYKLDHIDDIKSDDCGKWKHNGRKIIKVAVWRKNSTITKVVSTSKKAIALLMKTAGCIL